MAAGHGSLRSIRLKDDCEVDTWPAISWPEATLSSMPRLEEVEVADAMLQDLDGLLQDAAGCNKLRRVLVVGADVAAKGKARAPQQGALGSLYHYSSKGLQALAHGACSDSLQEVLLRTCGTAVPISSALPLLRLPAIKRVELSLQAQKGWPRLGAAQDRLHHAQELRALLCSHLQAQGFRVEMQGEVEEKDSCSIRASYHISEQGKQAVYVRLVQVALLVDGKQLRCTLVQQVQQAVALLDGAQKALVHAEWMADHPGVMVMGAAGLYMGGGMAGSEGEADDGPGGAGGSFSWGWGSDGDDADAYGSEED